jgi:hypothetical protein
MMTPVSQSKAFTDLDFVFETNAKANEESETIKPFLAKLIIVLSLKRKIAVQPRSELVCECYAMQNAKVWTPGKSPRL